MNEILYGKQELQKIVSIEPSNSSVEIFIQDNQGNVKSEFVENRSWILSHFPLKDFKKLQGNLYYQYGKQFRERNEFQKARSYLKNSDIFSIYDPKESFMVLKGYTYFKGLKHQDVTILSFDIETTTKDLNDQSKLLLISNTFRKNGIITKKLFSYDDYNDEGEMIEEWCKWVRKMDPSIITGHYILVFDLDYIQFIANKYNVALKLGRDGSNMKVNNYESQFRKDGSQSYSYYKHYIYGREIIDGYFLALKYDIGRKYDNYKLKNIIKQEGLEKQGRVFYDASKIRENYKNPTEWAKIKEYCIDDSDDSLAIFDLMSPALFYSAQMIPKPFQLISECATGSQINSIMMRSYLQNGHSLPRASDPFPFKGAISIGNFGIYRNVFKVDVSSLYPSIMIQYEVYDKDKDPNGNFLYLVKNLTEQRLINKKLAKETGDNYYKGLEQSQKILVNSAYGFLAAAGLIFNSPIKADFITETGRDILKKSILWATGKEYDENS